MRRFYLLLLVIPLMGMDGCEKELENSEGPEVAASTVLNDICYRLSADQVRKMKVNELSLAAKSVAVLNSPSYVEEIHQLQMSEISDDTCSTSTGDSVLCTEYKYAERIKHLADDEIYDFERILYLPKIEEEVQVQKIQKRSKEQEPLDSTIDQEICYLTQDLYESVGIKMTYHNLRVERAQMEVPKGRQERLGCEDYEDCKINIKRIRFDQILVSDNQRYRRNYLYEISNEVPYLSRILKRCIIHSLPYHFDDNENGQVDSGEMRVVAITECRDVLDFEYGQ
tara:strand:- start:2634 stop:3482 length:849 start_codon:yes stop_codon:yes gene_type:complete